MKDNDQNLLDIYTNKLNEVLEVSIEEVLEYMGEDIKGIEWFSSCAEQYNEEVIHKVA